MSSKSVLHLVGSPSTQFFYELSLIYAQGVFCPTGFRFTYLVVAPDSRWFLTEDLDELGPALTLGEVVSQLQSEDFHFAVPHIFCEVGLTTVRGLIQNLVGIPLVGSPPEATTVSASKLLTVSLAQSVGVLTAGTKALREEELESPELLDFPLVVKPDRADNSEGLSLVHSPNELESAYWKAKEAGDLVVTETFIPGREIRAAVVLRQGELQLLPVIEYHVSKEHPLRLAEDKLDFSKDGLPVSQVSRTEVGRSIPADLSDGLLQKVHEACKKVHLALGCRHFSLFDFRVHEETGDLYFLEAGLFWSFTPQSMISQMIVSDGTDLGPYIAERWREWFGSTSAPA